MGAFEHYSRGFQSFQAGKYNEAIIEFNQAVALDPQEFNAYHYRGAAYTNIGMFVEAIADFTKLIRITSPANASFYIERACVYHKQGRIDEAINDFIKAETIIAANKVDKEKPITVVQKNSIYDGLGACYYHQGKFDKAVFQLRKSIALNYPGSASSHLRLAVIHILQNKYDDAIEDCNSAIALGHNNLRDVYTRGIAYQKKGNIESAKKDFQTIWNDANPTFDRLLSGIRLRTLLSSENQEDNIDLIPLMTEVEKHPYIPAPDLFILALAYISTKQFAKAKEMCRTLLSGYLPLALGARHHKEFIQMMTNSKCWPDATDKQVENKNLKKVKAQLIDIISRIDDPKLKQCAMLQALCAETFLGRIFYTQRGFKKPSINSGSLQNILSMLEESIKANQKNISTIDQETWRTLQNTPPFKEWMENNFPEFYVQLEISIKSVKKNNEVDLYNKQGADFHRVGKLDEAIASFSKAIALDPNKAHFYSNRAFVYRRKGELEKAMIDINCAIRLDAKNSDYYNDRGITFYKLGLLFPALDDCNTAITLNKQYSKAYVNRVIISRDLGDFDKAREDFKQAWNSNVNAYYKLYSGIQLLKLNEKNIDLSPCCKELAEIPQKSAEELAILALAQAELLQFDQAKETCRALLKQAPINMMSKYLQREFIVLFRQYAQECVTKNNIQDAKYWLSCVLELDNKDTNALCLWNAYAQSSMDDAGLNGITIAHQSLYPFIETDLISFSPIEQSGYLFLAEREREEQIKLQESQQKLTEYLQKLSLFAVKQKQTPAANLDMIFSVDELIAMAPKVVMDDLPSLTVEKSARLLPG